VAREISASSFLPSFLIAALIGRNHLAFNKDKDRARGATVFFGNRFISPRDESSSPDWDCAA
jgi:hypothetical protein